MKPFPLLALVCIITGFASHTQAMTKHECIHIAKVSDDCHWSKATGGRRDGWFDAKARKEVMRTDTGSTRQNAQAGRSPKDDRGQASANSKHETRPRAAALPPGAATPTPEGAPNLTQDTKKGGTLDTARGTTFQIDQWESVFTQRERTVLRDGLLIKAQTMMGR